MASSTGHLEQGSGPDGVAERPTNPDRQRLFRRLGWMATSAFMLASLYTGAMIEKFRFANQVLGSDQVSGQEVSYLKHAQETAFIGGLVGVAIAGLALTGAAVAFVKSRQQPSPSPEVPAATS
ncbi:MAG TPA: hypothetical protein VGS28_03305 [Candidatus Saccharimonadales bacterium]|nr:hypothetical protein [Candidatus Saccharimonadales bacterium]